MADPVTDPVTTYIGGLQADQQTKADTWAAFRSKSPDDFTGYLQQSKLPQQAKADLWAMHQQHVAAFQKAQNMLASEAVEHQRQAVAQQAQPGLLSRIWNFNFSKYLPGYQAETEKLRGIQNSTNEAGPLQLTKASDAFEAPGMLALHAISPRAYDITKRTIAGTEEDLATDQSKLGNLALAAVGGAAASGSALASRLLLLLSPVFAYQGGKQVVQGGKKIAGAANNNERAEGAAEVAGGLGNLTLLGAGFMGGGAHAQKPVEAVATTEPLAARPEVKPLYNLTGSTAEGNVAVSHGETTQVTGTAAGHKEFVNTNSTAQVETVAPKKSTQEWYHGTAVENVESILKNGIRPTKQAENDAPIVSLTQNEKYARQYPSRPGQRAVVVANVPEHTLDTSTTKFTEEAYSKQTVPPSAIKEVRIYDEQNNLLKTTRPSAGGSTPDENQTALPEASGKKPPQSTEKRLDPREYADSLAEHLNSLVKPGETNTEANLSATAVGRIRRVLSIDARGMSVQDLLHKVNNWRNTDEIQKYLEKQKTGTGESGAAQATPVSRPAETSQGTGATGQAQGNFGTLETAFIKQYGAEHGQAIQELQRSAINEEAYKSAFKTYANHTRGGDPDALKTAIDVATRRLEYGRVGGNQPRYSQSQLRAMADNHLHVLFKGWEGLTDSQLAYRRVYEKLTSPQVEQQIAASGNPALLARYEALKQRTGGMDSSPIKNLAGKIAPGNQLSPGDLVRGTLRERLAQLDMHNQQARAAIRTEMTRMDQYSVQDTLGFIDRMEHGVQQPNSQDQKIADWARTELDSRRDAINALGTGKFDQFIENYFPHLWSNVGKAAAVFQGGRRGSMTGSANFLKARDYETFMDGIKAGLEPVSYNPIKMVLQRLGEMDKYLMAHKVLDDQIKVGTAKWVPEDANRFTPQNQIPEGWTRLKNDMLFGRSKLPASGGLPEAGSYYFHPDVARVLDSYLSPGLHGNPLYDAAAKYNNVVNMSNLGMAVFHGTETAFNAAVSTGSLGLAKLFRGDVLGAAKDMAKTSSLVYPVIDQYLRGNDLLKAGLEPSKYAGMAQELDRLQKAGGRLQMPQEYQNMHAELLKTQLKSIKDSPWWGDQVRTGKLPKAASIAWNTVGAAFEKMSYPLMQMLVPRVKLGAFAQLAEETVQRLGPNVSDEMLRHELGKAWDSVDNRFGELVHDNLFWDRTYKDLAHIGFRSLGWNLGTFRELGGGAADATRFVRGGSLTPRLAYSIMLPMVVAYTGALINAANGHTPSTLLDYFYPPDKNGNRSYLKTYVNDAVQFVKHPIDTIGHKASPLLAQAYEIMYNKDFYGNEISHGRSEYGFLGQFAHLSSYQEYASYLGKSSLPFSVQNFMKFRQEGGGDLSSVVKSAAGILPAPNWVGKTDAEQLAATYHAQNAPPAMRTKEEEVEAQAMNDLRTQYKQGKIGMDGLFKAVDQGKIGANKLDQIVSESEMSDLARNVTSLKDYQALEVYERATPAERKELYPILLDKMDGITDKHAKPYSDELAARYKRALNL